MKNLKYSDGSATYVELLEKKIAELEKQIVAIEKNTDYWADKYNWIKNNKPVAWINRKGKDGGYDYLQWDKDDEAEINTPLYTHPVKELTDEEINKLWAESHEDGIAVQQGFTTQQHYFAHLILRKASEK